MCSNNSLKIHTNKMISSVFVLIILTVILSGCSKTPKKNSPEFITDSSFLLNTVVSVTLYDKQDYDIIDECFGIISKYEKIFSRTDSSSELYALNHGTAPHTGLTYQVSDELSDIIKKGLYYSELSKGAFDITIAPVSSLWDFTSESPVVPADEDIKKALPYIGYQNVTLNGNQVTFKEEGIQFDLGAIAKGYIADKVKDYLISQGVKSAIINLGGNALCVGTKPDGTPFHVGIQKPFADRNVTEAVMEISDLSVVSSGIYERFFESDGKFYHHILDPKTGYSYDNKLISVTIISKISVDGDGLSTTCFSLGLEKGMELIENIPDTYAVFITDDYVLHYSKGFDKAIKILE